MHRVTKITTCCYCGARAALVLDKARHELTCGACGAPLHNMRQIPVAAAPAPQGPRSVRPDKPKKVKRKPKKSFARSFFSEAVDLIEDIFD